MASTVSTDGGSVISARAAADAGAPGAKGSAAQPEVVKAPALSDHKSSDAKADAQMMDYMREYFAKQPKVRIKVREQQFAQINGYTFIIEPNQSVDVPQDVADLLEQAGAI